MIGSGVDTATQPRHAGLRSPWRTAVVVLLCVALALTAWHLSRPVSPLLGVPIDIRTAPVPLNPHDPNDITVGNCVYAGGLVLTSARTGQLHELSDIEVTSTDTFTAVSDLGFLVDGRLVFDESGMLVGLENTRLTVLTAENGKPLTNELDADAEGLALLANGDRLVSFERNDRIWLYPAAGGPPRPVPAPVDTFPNNAGMEALAADPETGPDAYVVGAEASGATWSCRLSIRSCTRGPTVDKANEFGLVAMKRMRGMETVYLLRAFDPERGPRISVQIVRAGMLVDRMDLALPLTVDNYEGLAAVPRTDGGIRIYLISDDNGREDQRTLLLAFDWLPG